MKVKELMAVTRIHRLVILENNHPVKVIASTTNNTEIARYKEKEIEDIEPYLESKLDVDGDLRVQAKLEVYIYD